MVGEQALDYRRQASQRSSCSVLLLRLTPPSLRHNRPPSSGLPCAPAHQLRADGREPDCVRMDTEQLPIGPLSIQRVWMVMDQLSVCTCTSEHLHTEEFTPSAKLSTALQHRP
ncbi:hypothetical protein SRHO_G00124910 [Serrasalmus rhombeus]